MDLQSKRCVEDLAILGGPAMFREPLHVGRPNTGRRDRLFQRIGDVIDSRRLTNNGPYVQEFEDAVANFVGAKYCVATCNGTLALELAIQALGFTGEALVPSFTFIATAHALRRQSITPVFCDIESNGYNLDPEDAKSRITPHTSGIVGVHLWGRPCQVDALTALASKHGLKLLFDASQSFGCSYRGAMLGAFGGAEVFSFHATKIVNAFEGGAIVTNDGALATQLRLMRNFGFSGMDNVSCLGTNAKMSEVSAAMGLSCLEDLERLVQINQRNYQCYARLFEETPGVRVVPYEQAERSNYHYVVLEIDEDLTRISRDDLMNVLRAEGVLARRYFYPGCHDMEPYRTEQPTASTSLPNTAKAVTRTLVLPTGEGIDHSSINGIGYVVRFALGNAHQLTTKLNRRAVPG